MRGKLDDATTVQIESSLPDSVTLGKRVLSLSPDFVSIVCAVDSRIPVAVPCLHDASHVTNEARYALCEALKNLAWYRKFDPAAPNERMAIFLGRFFATAAASCLYAAGEDVANAIIEMYELDREKIDLECEKQTSVQSKLGRYMSKHIRSDTLSQAIIQLAGSDSWVKTMLWRNRWVHEQAPIRGLGLSYRRIKRWKSGTNRAGAEVQSLRIGIGDRIEYSVDDVIAFVQPAFVQFVKTFGTVSNRYLQILSEAGIGLQPESGKMSIRL